MDTDALSGGDDLRRRAEERIQERIATLPKLSPEEVAELVHELDVHRVELQMQNEELRANQQLLEESRDRYADLYDFAPVGYVTLNEQGLVQEINLTAATTLQSQRQMLLGVPLARFIEPGDKRTFHRHLARCHDEVEDVTTELRLRGKAGRVTPVQIRSRRSDAPDGAKWYRTSLTDISALAEAEEALSESEGRFRALVMASSDVVYRMSPDWSEMRQLHGRDFIADTESPSRTWLQKYIHPDDQPHVLAVIKEAIRIKSIFELEHRVLRVDGSLGWAFSRAVPMLDARGEIIEWFGAAKDITERKQAEAALREGERHLTADLDAMTRLQQIGTLFVRQGNLEPVLAEIVEAAIAISVADLGNIQLLDPMSNTLQIVAQRGFPQWYLGFWNSVAEGRGTCGTALERGERVIVEDVERSPIFAGTDALEMQLKAGVRACQSTPLVSRSGKLLGMFSTHYKTPHRPDDRALRLLDLLARQAGDIIDRAQAEAALRESEQRLALAASGTRIGMFDWNIVTGEILGTDQFARLLGIETTTTTTTTTTTLSQSYHYRDWAERVHPGDLQAVEAQLHRAMAEQMPYEGEYRVVWPDRSTRWIAVRGVFQDGSAGQRQRMVGILMDITERKRAEQQLFEAKQRLQALMEATPVGVSFSDDPNCQRITGNPAVLAQFEVRPEDNLSASASDPEAPGRQVRFLRDGQPITDADLPLQRAVLENAIVPPMELEVRLPSGRRWFADVSGAPIRDPQGNVIGGVAVTVDVTERKQAEQALAQAKAAADAANRAKSEFLANMSHEIRTPMTAVLGFAELLAEMDCSEEEQREYLQTIQQSGKGLLQLIDDILDLSKVEAGRPGAESVECSPRQIVEEVVALMQVRADEKRLALDVNYRHPLPLVIVTDPGRLRQILMNLVGNAIKFTLAGQVLVDVSYTARERPRMQFAVSDTGVGIGEDHLEEIFRPFHQADSSVTRQFGGTGLGLTISRRLAETMGGRLTVQSELGRGSTFTLTIEAGSIAASTLVESFGRDAGAAADASPASVRLTGSVLLVEDTPANQHVVEVMLSKAGLDVDVSDSGEEACRMAAGSTTAGEPYDVILMDMQMPGLDGYESTRRLRRDGWRGPIIALTAHAMAGDREKCLAAGCDDYLAKPVSRESLVKVVSRFLGPGSPASSAPLP